MNVGRAQAASHVGPEYSGNLAVGEARDAMHLETGDMDLRAAGRCGRLRRAGRQIGNRRILGSISLDATLGFILKTA